MYIYKSRLNITENGGEYAARYLSELDEEYKRLIKTPIPKLTEEKFGEFKRSGVRLGHECDYFLRRTMLRDYALKLWLGDETALKPLETIVDAICDEFTWILPAHEGNGDLRTQIDLFAAETAQSLTEIISLVGDSLNTQIKEKAIGEVQNRVLQPFIKREKKYGWETSESNWSAVCGGSVGMTALYLIEDNTALKKLLLPLQNSFDCYMKSFSGDGACLEGLYYWGYGMTYLTAFLELYREKMGEDFPVNSKKLIKMADFAHKCCISGGITASFSDSSEYDRIYSGLSAKLTESLGAAPVPPEYRAYLYGDDCGRWCRAARDIAWTRVAEEKPLPRMTVLPMAQWAVVRGGKMSFAVKGGNNGESHNHNDIGSFIVTDGDKILLRDLGAGEYTKDYFSKNRYNILCNRSMGHSVPIIDGSEQKTGSDYAAKDFEACGGKVRMDIAGAYGIGKLRSLVREISCGGDEIVLTDTFEIEENTQIRERFIVSDEDAVKRLHVKHRCTREINTYVHHTHDGEAVEITAVDFIFETASVTEFELVIK